MLKKKMVVSTVLLSMVSLGFAGQVLAAEGDSQTINGNEDAQVITRGRLGKSDNTKPDDVIPEHDKRWINVTLPTEVIFESDVNKGGDGAKITSPDNYKITNHSGRPVKVEVTEYEIKDGGDALAALKSLNLERIGNVDTASQEGHSTISLVSKAAEKKKYAIDTKHDELVKLANSDKKMGAETPAKTNEIGFRFTGDIDKAALAGKRKKTIESALTFKFTALDMNGK